MKLLDIVLFLFNIFGFAISTDELIPQNVEIVLRQYTDPFTGKRQEKTYEKRSNYLEEGDRFSEKEFQDLSDLNALQGIRDELKKAADDIVQPYNENLKSERHQDKLKADDTARFSVTFTGLDVEAVHKLLAEEPNPKRISGKVKIGYNFEDRMMQLDAQLAALHGTGAAAAAEPPPKGAVLRPAAPLHPPMVAAGLSSSEKSNPAAAEPISTNPMQAARSTMPFESTMSRQYQDYMRQQRSTTTTTTTQKGHLPSINGGTRKRRPKGS